MQAMLLEASRANLVNKFSGGEGLKGLDDFPNKMYIEWVQGTMTSKPVACVCWYIKLCCVCACVCACVCMCMCVCVHVRVCF